MTTSHRSNVEHLKQAIFIKVAQILLPYQIFQSDIKKKLNIISISYKDTINRNLVVFPTSVWQKSKNDIESKLIWIKNIATVFFIGSVFSIYFLYFRKFMLFYRKWKKQNQKVNTFFWSFIDYPIGLWTRKNSRVGRDLWVQIRNWIIFQLIFLTLLSPVVPRKMFILWLKYQQVSYYLNNKITRQWCVFLKYLDCRQWKL